PRPGPLPVNASSTAARVIRSLRRSPGFVAIATISMGVALGISTSMFAFMDAMTHPEPPFRDVDQLAFVSLGMRVTNPPPAAEVLRQVNALEGVEATANWRVVSNFGMVMLGTRLGQISTISFAGPGALDLLGVRPR